MKILHVGEYVNGGVATYLKTLINGLQQYKDIDNYLVMSKYKSEQNWGDMQDKVTYYEYRRSIWNIFKAMVFIYKFITLIPIINISKIINSPNKKHWHHKIYAICQCLLKIYYNFPNKN